MNHHRPTGRGARAAIVAAALAMLIGVAPAAAATGNFGTYALVDLPDSQSVTCTYTEGPLLVKFRIRPPIVYAFSRTAATDTQTVGWRFLVQWQDEATAGPATWTTMFTSSELKGSATDKRNAAFSPRTYTFGPDVEDHAFYRVVYDLRWYFPTSTHQDGRATPHPGYYKIKFMGFPDATILDFCSAHD